MTGRLANKVAIVTGAGSGIGKATVELFRSEGATVVGADIKGADADCDAGNEEQVRALVEWVAHEHGGLDIFFANAGISGGFDSLFEQDAATWAEAALLLDATARAGGDTDPWRRADGWRLGPSAPRLYRLREERGDTAVVRVCGTGVSLSVAVGEGPPRRADVRLGERVQVSLDGVARSFAALVSADVVELTRAGATFRIRIADAQHGAGESADEKPHLDSPMPGTVVMVPAIDGARVEAGDPVVVVEAMKMEHVVRAAVAGAIAVHVAVGDQVARGQTLATVTPDA